MQSKNLLEKPGITKFLNAIYCNNCGQELTEKCISSTCNIKSNNIAHNDKSQKGGNDQNNTKEDSNEVRSENKQEFLLRKLYESVNQKTKRNSILKLFERNTKRYVMCTLCQELEFLGGLTSKKQSIYVMKRHIKSRHPNPREKVIKFGNSTKEF